MEWVRDTHTQNTHTHPRRWSFAAFSSWLIYMTNWVRDSFIHSYGSLIQRLIHKTQWVRDWSYEAWQVNWRWSSHGRPSTMELCLIQFVIQSLDSFICDKHTRWIGDDDHAVDPSIMKLRLIQFVTQSRDSLSSWLILHSYDSSRGRSLDDGAPPHLVRDSCTCHITHWNVNVTDIKMYR